jgi:hypothetical protein
MNQKMWSMLKAYILSKNSHGKNELLSAMVNIEIAESGITGTVITQSSNDSYQGPG